MPPEKLVVLTDKSVHPLVVDRLRTRATVRILDAYPDEATLTEACRDADADASIIFQLITSLTVPGS